MTINLGRETKRIAFFYFRGRVEQSVDYGLFFRVKGETTIFYSTGEGRRISL